MTPLELARESIGRAVNSFHPKTVPLMLRANYARELAAWCVLPVMLGVVEGGVVGVIAKSYFGGIVPAAAVNLSVAFLSGAPAFANLVSFVWAALGHGRPKIRMLVMLQVAAAICVFAAAAAPSSGLGLLVLTTGVIGARMCWSGVIVLRSTLWRANYPRHTRARLAGKLATVQAVVMTLVAIGLGLATNVREDAFRLVFPPAATCGFVGAWIYAGVRVRGHRALLRAERNDGETLRGGFSVLQLWRVLGADAAFRRYMLCMLVFGSGNLMVIAPLIIMLRDRFGLDPFNSILIVAAIPMLLMPVSIPIWSRLLDRVHIIRFRSVHSWAFVASTSLFLAGALTGLVPLLWAGAVMKGIAFGGGVLAWNLGHNDFASDERSAQYMGVHASLTGLRGLVAPILGVGIYENLERTWPGSGPWVLAVCLVLTVTGAVWFGLMRRTLSGPGCDSEFEDGPPVQPPAAS